MPEPSSATTTLSSPKYRWTVPAPASKEFFTSSKIATSSSVMSWRPRTLFRPVLTSKCRVVDSEEASFGWVLGVTAAAYHHQKYDGNAKFARRAVALKLRHG